MTDEQDRVLEALQIAIQMETEGRECYLGAEQQSGNEVGRRLLRSLADEEEAHKRQFQEVYEAIRRKKGWPQVDLRSGAAERLRDLFSRSCDVAGVNVAGGDSDFNAVKTALEKEKQSYDFYTRRSETATYDAERDFYRAVAAEEREHELILLDYYEYLSDPVDYFRRQEHHSLDGG